MARVMAVGQRVSGRRFGILATLSRRLSGRRLALTAAISLLVSTEALFLSLPADAWVPAIEATTWLAYAAECLLKGTLIMLTLTFAEVLTRNRPRWQAFGLYAAALAAGTLGGGLLLSLLQQRDWSVVATRRFWFDAVFWMAIGHGNATIHLLQQRAARAANDLHRAQIRRIALGQQLLEARLHVLQAQLEPHFLFNALANVKRLCRNDVASGIAMLGDLSQYLRAALPQMRDAQTTLGQEIDLVSAYLGILKIRMGERLRYAIEIPGDLASQPFPPMLLLTLAENAIKHGLGPAPRGGSIAIRARADEGELEVSVADSGVGFAAAPTSGSGIGLANTRARLLAAYGEAGVLALAPNVPTGVVATIRMPLAAASAAGPG